MSLFHPKLSFHRVTEITKEVLDKHDVKGLVIDIDNTLTKHNSQEISKEILYWLENINKSYPIILLSNNNKHRVIPFGQMVNLEYIYNGGKPLPFLGFKKASSQLGIPIENLAVIGDQIFTDILGGNLSKAVTVLVEPMEQEGGLFFHIKRFFENLVMRNYEKQEKGIE